MIDVQKCWSGGEVWVDFFLIGDDEFCQWDRKDSNWSSNYSKIHYQNYRKYLQGHHILQLPQRPPLCQLGQCIIFWYHLLTGDIAREYPAVKHQSISFKAMLEKEETELTSSTTLTDPEHHLAHLDDPGSLRRFHRSVPSQLRCHFYRILMKRTVQNEAVGHLFSGELVDHGTSDTPG